MNLSDAERKDLILTHLSREYPNHFLLTKAVALRARELKSGSAPLVDGFTDDQARNQSVLVALEEFYAEKLVIKNNQPEPVVVETPKPSTDTEASAETDVETDVETETRA
jgi:DNA-directed RNA polymerase subunit K/omega